MLSSDQKGKWDVGNYRKENKGGGKKDIMKPLLQSKYIQIVWFPHLKSTEQNCITSVTVTEYGVIFMEK